MLGMTVLCVGKLKEAYWRDACEEYAKRLGAFCRFQVIEVAEERVAENPSLAQIAATVEAEGKRLLEKMPRDSYGIALCVEGKQLSSPALAGEIQRQMVAGCSHIALFIGGSWGLSEAVKAKCQRRLSMSEMTFPHQLARVMLLEQLYRACQINSGGKYHK